MNTYCITFADGFKVTVRAAGFCGATLTAVREAPGHGRIVDLEPIGKCDDIIEIRGPKDGD